MTMSLVRQDVEGKGVREFGVLTGVLLKIPVFCSVTPCCLVNNYRHLEVSCFLLLRSQTVQKDRIVLGLEKESIAIILNVGNYLSQHEVTSQ